MLPPSLTFRPVKQAEVAEWLNNGDFPQLDDPADDRLLDYLVEEFVARGCGRIVMLSSADDGVRQEVASLPDPLRRILDVVEPYDEARQTFSLLEKAATDLELEIEAGKPLWSPPFGYLLDERDCTPQQRLASIQRDVFYLLLGMHHKAQIDVDMEALSTHLAWLIGSCRSSEARAPLSYLLGAARSYQPREVFGLATASTSGASREFIGRLDELLADSAFCEYSASWRGLSLGREVSRWKHAIARSARTLLQNPVFAGFFDLGSRAVSTSTGLPVPDSQLASAVLGAGYMPVVVGLSESIRDAIFRWESANPGHLMTVLSPSADGRLGITFSCPSFPRNEDLLAYLSGEPYAADSAECGLRLELTMLFDAFVTTRIIDDA